MAWSKYLARLGSAFIFACNAISLGKLAVSNVSPSSATITRCWSSISNTWNCGECKDAAWSGGAASGGHRLRTLWRRRCAVAAHVATLRRRAAHVRPLAEALQLGEVGRAAALQMALEALGELLGRLDGAKRVLHEAGRGTIMAVDTAQRSRRGGAHHNLHQVVAQVHGLVDDLVVVHPAVVLVDPERLSQVEQHAVRLRHEDIAVLQVWQVDQRVLLLEHGLLATVPGLLHVVRVRLVLELLALHGARTRTVGKACAYSRADGEQWTHAPCRRTSSAARRPVP
eukprot:1644011-Prymnesium_polylepis.2